MSHYNTTNLTGKEYETATKKTEFQCVVILRIFRNGSKLTPFDIQKITISMGYNYPITSIRRAITDLTNSGQLTKCDKFRDGEYGAKNHLWEIR